MDSWEGVITSDYLDGRVSICYPPGTIVRIRIGEVYRDPENPTFLERLTDVVRINRKDIETILANLDRGKA